MEPTIVDRLVEDNNSLVEFLKEKGEISLLSNAENSFRRTLLLTTASYFESEVKDAILNFVSRATTPDSPVVHLVRAKAIVRQYHTLFQWDKRNANHFYSHFGPGFRTFMERKIQQDDELDDAVRCFLEIGDLRNQLVHQNFATFEIEKTAPDIFRLYARARLFVDSLEGLLIQHNDECAGTEGP